MTEPPPRIPGTTSPLRTGPAGQTPDEAKFKRIAEVEESDETDSSKEGPAKNLFLSEEEEDSGEVQTVKDPALFKSIIQDQTGSGLPKKPVKGIKTEVGPATSKKSPSPYLPPPLLKEVKEEESSHLILERSEEKQAGKPAMAPRAAPLVKKQKTAESPPTAKKAAPRPPSSPPSPAFEKRSSHPADFSKIEKQESSPPYAKQKAAFTKTEQKPLFPVPKPKNSLSSPSFQRNDPSFAREPLQAKERDDIWATEKEKKESDMEPSLDVVAAPSSILPPDGMGIIPPSSPIEVGLASLGPVGALSRLDPEVMALFQKMVGLMILDATKPGILTSTTTLSMPGSVFDGSSIVLTHYSTAPLAFNLQLLGSVDAVRIFEANQSSLAAAFQQGKFDFSVHILKPALEVPQEDRKKQRVRRTMKKKKTDNEEG